MQTQTGMIDSERTLAAFEANARWAALSLVISRIDAGMDPDEARESVVRWGRKVASKVARGVEYGARDGMPEHDEGPRHDST